MKTLSQYAQASIVFVVLSLLYCFRLLLIALLDTGDLVTFVPDDAFYYLSMAQHKSQLGFWSFDGSNFATGFHILFAYFVLGAFSLFASDEFISLFIFFGVLGSLALAYSGALLFLCMRQFFSLGSSLAGLGVFLTPLAFLQPHMMMESWIVIVLGAQGLYVSLQSKSKPASRYLLLILLGVLLSFSRSDAGLLPGLFCVLFGARAFFHRSQPNFFRALNFIFWLMGSCIGLALTILHTYAISGGWVSASAEIKAYWSDSIGYTVAPILEVLQAGFSPVYQKSNVLFQWCVVITLAYYSFKFIKLPRTKTSPASTLFMEQIFFATTAALVIICYVLFYGLNSQSIQYWYFANFILCCGILIAFFVETIPESARLKCSIVFLALHLVFVGVKMTKETWPHQRQMYYAAQELNSIFPENDVNFGAWNAGILGYFSSNPIINLDGLANDSVVNFIKEGALGDYLDKNEIHFIVDFDSMFSDTTLQLRGGYSEAQFAARIRKVFAFKVQEPTWMSTSIGLYCYRSYPCMESFYND